MLCLPRSKPLFLYFAHSICATTRVFIRFTREHSARPSWNLAALLCEASVMAPGKLWLNRENLCRCVFVWMHLSVPLSPSLCVCVHTHTPAGGNLQCHSLEAIHLLFSDKAPHGNLGFTDRATMASQWASGICESPSSWCWDYKCAPHLAFSCARWALNLGP